MYRNLDRDWVSHSNEYAKKRYQWIQEHNLSDINMEFIGPETVFGSLGNHSTIEGLINSNNYNLRPKKDITLLLPNHLKLRNQKLFNYFKPYLNVVRNQKIINSLKNLENYLSIPMGFLIPFKNKSVFHQFLSPLVEQKQLSSSGIKPTFTLSEEDKKRGKEVLKKMGIEKDWHVTLHVREPGYHGGETESFRNSDPNNYIKSIKLITDKGGWVFRMGDPSMKKMPKIDKLVDYAHSEFKSDFMDVYLAATSKFCIGTSSGYYTVPSFFGVPILLTNVAGLSQCYNLKSKNIFIPRLIKNKYKNEYLSLKQLLSHPLIYFNSDELFKRDGLITEENNSDDIADATIEMIDNLFKNQKNQTDILQKKFTDIAEKNIYDLTNDKIPSFANIGKKLINKYQKYLI